MSEAEFDLLVVGGGINGAGIARDAAGRGLSAMLVEKDDLAAHTSSASSKLVHGGLRYLAQFEFKLVRESLTERERLLRAAPHIVQPVQFVLPLSDSSRPAWMLQAGLLLYDRLGGRRLLPASRSIDLRGPFGTGLKAGPTKAFTYWDCRVQDSRLVVLNAIDAQARGAMILTRTELIEARREGGFWAAKMQGAGGSRSVRARALVNATGPWAAQLFERIHGTRHRKTIRLVKGSHIVVPRLYPGDHAFILQNPDRRVVFAIPFEGHTLVGTTDVTWSEPPGDPAISDEEVDYLLATIGRTFAAEVAKSDITWSYSGVRSLVDDGSPNPSTVTRDYVLELDDSGAPLLSVFGGKLTTYRALSERAVDRLAPFLSGTRRAWTDRVALPGGDIPNLDLGAFVQALLKRRPGIPSEIVERLVRTYGTRSERLLDDDPGEHFGAGLHAREVDYLVAHEWAVTAEDILFRRTKLGLHIAPEGIARLEAYLSSRVPAGERGRF